MKKRPNTITSSFCSELFKARSGVYPPAEKYTDPFSVASELFQIARKKSLDSPEVGILSMIPATRGSTTWRYERHG